MQGKEEISHVAPVINDEVGVFAEQLQVPPGNLPFARPDGFQPGVQGDAVPHIIEDGSQGFQVLRLSPVSGACGVPNSSRIPSARGKRINDPSTANIRSSSQTR